MQFSDSTNKLGIIEQTDFLCDTDSTSYPTAQKTREINSAYEEIVSELLNLDGRWQFDDENYTTIPEGTTTLVAGQSDYSFASTFLNVNWVKIKDIGGNWLLIKPIDQAETGLALEQLLITNGFPQFYDKTGDTIRLYPAPSASQVTLTNGMKVGYARTASLFTASDTTKVPGFASPFHIILAYMAAVPYCMKYKKDRVVLYQQKVLSLKSKLKEFYSNREKDKRKVASTAKISFR